MQKGPHRRYHSVIVQGLTQLDKNYAGTSVCYLGLDLHHRDLEELDEDIEQYTFLRYVNLSRNALKSVQQLSLLPNIQRIDFQRNKISNLEPFSDSTHFRSLEYLDLSKNLIRTLTLIKAPNLDYLNLADNKIESVKDFGGHPHLRQLELRKNRLESIVGLEDLPNLEELYLAENRIKAIEALTNAPKLRILHMRKNKICKLEEGKVPHLPNLEYLNIRMNDYTKTPTLALFSEWKKLRRICTINCPLLPEPSGDIRLELLILLPWLEVINKYKVQDADRMKAENEELNRKLNVPPVVAEVPEFYQEVAATTAPAETKRVDPFEDDDWW